jgi:flagellar motor switch protein FliM
MADDILSQEEVDALLRGVTGDTEQAPVVEDRGVPRPYDIGRQERIVRGRMPTLELVNERFARLLRIGLFNFMRKSAEVSVGPVRVLKFSEFVRNLAVPTNLNLVQVKPLRGMALMVFEPTLVFQVVDNLFGGHGRFHTRVEGRDFTPTEMRIVERMLHVVFEEYEKSWKPIFSLKFEYVRSEMNTQFANIATPTEVVVATTFSIDLGAGGGDFHVCMPYAMLEPIRDVIYSTIQADRSDADDRWLALLTSQVYGAEVELVANLATAQVTVAQLMTLQAGDVISLDLPDAVAAAVDGVPVLECRYGVMNGQYALKVEKLVGSASAEPRGGGRNGGRLQD